MNASTFARIGSCKSQARLERLGLSTCSIPISGSMPIAIAAMRASASVNAYNRLANAFGGVAAKRELPVIDETRFNRTSVPVTTPLALLERRCYYS